jgi:hypothetical protein
MSAKFSWPCALVLAVLGICAARAEQLWYTERQEDRPAPTAVPPPQPAPAHGELSSWIRYGRPDCCDPIGGDGPILTELYVRNGPTLPVAGGVINNTLALGWMVQGGGRSLFFDPSMSAAWTADLSISHIYNRGNQDDLNFRLLPQNGEERTGNVRTLHRTMFGLALGREWYVNGAANDFRHYWALWRFGFDGGARLGTSSIHFNEQRTGENFQRTHDVFWAAFFALHTDVEIPCGCCTFFTGIRAEWQYSWLDIFPFDPKSNLHDVNLLLNAGVRY